jgi:hypothetical protein
VGKDINLHDPSPYWLSDAAATVTRRIGVPLRMAAQDIRQIDLWMFITFGGSLSNDIFVKSMGGAGPVPGATAKPRTFNNEIQFRNVRQPGSYWSCNPAYDIRTDSFFPKKSEARSRLFTITP